MARSNHYPANLAICSANLTHLPPLALLNYLAEKGISSLELGVGGYPGTIHANAQHLVGDTSSRQWWRQETVARGLRIGALSCHGNPLHPDTHLAAGFHRDFMAALEAANAMEVPVVVGFSGQPGTGGVTNWPVIAWPFEYADLYERQWQEQLIPYWQKIAQRAQELGVKIALEMHGGFAVHSPATLLRLRKACGPALGANLDPSHLWWQLIDPVAAVHLLGASLFHVHLKDVRFNPEALNRHGILDMTPHHQPQQRAWSFVVPGDGHSSQDWQSLISAVQANAYSGVFSIEHEAPMPVEEGVERCLELVQQLRWA